MYILVQLVTLRALKNYTRLMYEVAVNLRDTLMDQALHGLLNNPREISQLCESLPLTLVYNLNKQ